MPEVLGGGELVWSRMTYFIVTTVSTRWSNPILAENRTVMELEFNSIWSTCKVK